MNKFTVTSLFLAPVVCLNVYADATAPAKDALKGTLTELTTLTASAQDKDLEQLITDLHTLLEKNTPGILAALEPLTDEQRMSVIGELAQAPELGELMLTAASLQESKAAASLLPLLAGDAPVDADVISYGAKMKVIDIVANLTKIAVGLGADKMLATALTDDDDDYEDEYYDEEDYDYDEYDEYED